MKWATVIQYDGSDQNGTAYERCGTLTDFYFIINAQIEFVCWNKFFQVSNALRRKICAVV